MLTAVLFHRVENGGQTQTVVHGVTSPTPLTKCIPGYDINRVASAGPTKRGFRASSRSQTATVKMSSPRTSSCCCCWWCWTVDDVMR